MSSYPFTSIDHVQLAMPAGAEETARGFYRDLLGMAELPKPAELAKRGGCWFESGTVQLHLGVEVEFRAARKAHPALCCQDYEALTSLWVRQGLRSRTTTASRGFDAATCVIRSGTGSS